MLKAFFVILSSLTLLLIMGCSEESITTTQPELNALSDNDNAVGMLSFEDELTNLAKSLSENADRITEAIDYNLGSVTKENLYRQTLSLSKINLPEEKTATYLIDANGNEFEIRLEFFKHSRPEKGQPIRVTLDPEVFHYEKESFPVFCFNAKKRVLETEYLNMEDHDVALPYQLVFVTLRDVGTGDVGPIYDDQGDGSSVEAYCDPPQEGGRSHSENCSGSGGGSGGNYAGIYVGLVDVWAKDEMDGWGNDEFELFVNFGGATMPSGTHLIFDGSSRMAAGKHYDFPDVEPGGWCPPNEPIPLFKLNEGTIVDLMPIEDDYSAGNYYVFSALGGPITVYKELDKIYRLDEVSNVPVDPTVNWLVPLTDATYGFSANGYQFPNDDDLYAKAMIKGFSLDNINSNKVFDLNYSGNDVRLKLQLMVIN